MIHRLMTYEHRVTGVAFAVANVAVVEVVVAVDDAVVVEPMINCTIANGHLEVQ